MNQGCFATSTLSNYFSEQGSSTSNSITFCSNLCKGKNFPLAALSVSIIIINKTSNETFIANNLKFKKYFSEVLKANNIVF